MKDVPTFVGARFSKFRLWGPAVPLQKLYIFVRARTSSTTAGVRVAFFTTHELIDVLIALFFWSAPDSRSLE